MYSRSPKISLSFFISVIPSPPSRVRNFSLCRTGASAITPLLCCSSSSSVIGRPSSSSEPALCANSVVLKCRSVTSWHKLLYPSISAASSTTGTLCTSCFLFSRHSFTPSEAEGPLNINLHPHNRLHPCFPRCLTKPHRRVHPIRVRQRHGRYLLLRRRRDNLFRRRHPPQERIVAVAMEMNKHVTGDS